jgi:TATA-binding protein-associated factor Taf7
LTATIFLNFHIFARSSKTAIGMLMAAAIYLRLLFLSKLSSEYFSSLVFRAAINALQSWTLANHKPMARLSLATGAASGQRQKAAKKRSTMKGSRATSSRQRRKLDTARHTSATVNNDNNDNDDDEDDDDEDDDNNNNDNDNDENEDNTSLNQSYMLVMQSIHQLDTLLDKCNFQVSERGVFCVHNRYTLN